MSKLLGTTGDPWSLARAVDALAVSARRAGIPGPIWIAGICYPSLDLTLGLVEQFVALIETATALDIPGFSERMGLSLPVGQALYHTEPSWARHVLSVFLLLLLPIFARWIVGLSRVSEPTNWRRESEGLRTVKLRSAWRAGAGLALPTIGMFFLLQLLLWGALIVLLGPLVVFVHLFALNDFTPLLAGLFAPFLFVFLLYGIVLQVMQQLALHSLAHNRRGVASALTHAWRLVRNHPLGALRATLVDLVLALSLVVLITIVELVASPFGPLEVFAIPIVLALAGFAGVTRAGYWSRTYRGLGGLSPDDVVPGL
jgi:hypothetical protein